MLREYLKSLADKFREVLGYDETTLINAQYFTLTIDEVYEAGKQAGGGSADDGKKFWDMVFDDGFRSTFNYTFSYWKIVDSDGNITFNPPYDIVPVGATQIFAYIDAEIDLEAHLQSIGRKLDFSKCVMSRQGFQNSKFTRIGKCDFSKNNACNRTFEGCDCLVTIDEMVLLESVNYDFTSLFKGCAALKNLIVTGKIPRSFDAKDSPLTAASGKSILNALVDFSDTSNAFSYTVSLSPETWSLLDAEGNASPNGNSWRDYVSDKGWNI